MRFLFVLLLSLLSFTTAAQAVPPPVLAAKSWVLVDHASGQVLADRDADARIKPASLTKLIAWRGCNGNGRDDGWAQTYELSKTGNTIAFKQIADVSLCPREERSHGTCTTAASDPNTAFCSWTEGNTQPQRDGTWLAAIDISGATTGQASILWKQQIEGRKELASSDGKSRAAFLEEARKLR